MSKNQPKVTSNGQPINHKPLGMRIWNHRGFYLMFLPVFIYVLIVYYWPSLGVRYSFYDYTLKKIEFVGMKHFQSMFADADFWKAFAPELPHDTIYNIVYGKRKSSGAEKIFVIRGISNGQEVVLTFHHEHDKWKLTKLME